MVQGMISSSSLVEISLSLSSLVVALEALLLTMRYKDLKLSTVGAMAASVVVGVCVAVLVYDLFHLV
jgi:hypothetical protein